MGCARSSSLVGRPASPSPALVIGSGRKTNATARPPSSPLSLLLGLLSSRWRTYWVYCSIQMYWLAWSAPSPRSATIAESRKSAVFSLGCPRIVGVFSFEARCWASSTLLLLPVVCRAPSSKRSTISLLSASGEVRCLRLGLLASVASKLIVGSRCVATLTLVDSHALSPLAMPAPLPTTRCVFDCPTAACGRSPCGRWRLSSPSPPPTRSRRLRGRRLSSLSAMPSLLWWAPTCRRPSICSDGVWQSLVKRSGRASPICLPCPPTQPRSTIGGSPSP